MFRDRTEAGKLLGTELAKLDLKQPLVLALPRGGVPVAAEVAAALHARLDILVVGKVGAPLNPELAVAAIVHGDPPDVVLNRDAIEAFGLDDEELRTLIKAQRPELERRRIAYLGEQAPYSVAGKTAILVDDGAATGTTMKVAIRALRRRSPQKVVVAVPAAPAETVAQLEREADRVVCLEQPLHFRALGYHYRDFRQLTDEDVRQVMKQARGGDKIGLDPLAHGPARSS